MVPISVRTSSATTSAVQWGRLGDRPQDGQSLGRDLEPMIAKQFGRIFHHQHDCRDILDFVKNWTLPKDFEVAPVERWYIKEKDTLSEHRSATLPKSRPNSIQKSSIIPKCLFQLQQAPEDSE